MLHPCPPSNLPCLITVSFSVFFFFFSLLLVPLLYGSGSLDSISLPRFFSIGFPISLLANLRRLPRPCPRCYYLLDDDACLLVQVSHDTISNLCTFVGRSVRFAHSYLAMNVLPFGGVTLFGLALFAITKFFNDGGDDSFNVFPNQKMWELF